MPITKQKAFVTSDNQVFTTLEEAQKHECVILFSSAGMGPALTPEECQNAIERATACVITNKDKFLAILATRKPRAPKAKTVRIKKTATVVTMEGK